MKGHKSLIRVFLFVILGILVSCGGGGGGSGSNIGGEECVNIAGEWDYYETLTYTCTYAGETESETVSGSGTLTIYQDGCNVRWTVPGFDVDRTGTIEGDNIQVSGEFMVPLVGGINLTENIFTASGTISGDEINMRGTGSAKGTYEGMSFSCTGTSTLALTRVRSSSIFNVDEEIQIYGKPNLLFNGAMQLLGIVLP
jgi:hypothetical protein